MIELMIHTSVRRPERGSKSLPAWTAMGCPRSCKSPVPTESRSSPQLLCKSLPAGPLPHVFPDGRLRVPAANGHHAAGPLTVVSAAGRSASRPSGASASTPAGAWGCAPPMATTRRCCTPPLRGPWACRRGPRGGCIFPVATAACGPAAAAAACRTYAPMRRMPRRGKPHGQIARAREVSWRQDWGWARTRRFAGRHGTFSLRENIRSDFGTCWTLFLIFSLKQVLEWD
jgi:hypothetical protein